MLSVIYNPSVLKAQNYLTSAVSSVSSALERMSTGYRINSAKDDAAGMFVASNLNVRIRGLAVARANVDNGIALINTASKSLSNMNSILSRIRDLALQGSNGVYDDLSRGAMQAEADALIAELYQIKDGTQFNGKRLFSSGTGVVGISSAAAWSLRSADASVRSGGSSSVVMGKAVGGVSALSTLSRTTPGQFIQTVEKISEQEAIAQGYTLIKTAADLDNIRNNINADGNIDGKYILMNDIDLSGYSNWIPIGANSNPDMYDFQFTGIFDGNGYSIKNLKIDSDTSAGLFDELNNATIKNMGIINANVKGKNQAGILAVSGYETTITNCFSTGSVALSYNDWPRGGNAGGLSAQWVLMNTVQKHYHIVIQLPVFQVRDLLADWQVMQA